MVTILSDWPSFSCCYSVSRHVLDPDRQPYLANQLILTPSRYSDTLQTVALAKEYLAGSGIGGVDRDVVLFCRESFRKQMDFMQRAVSDGYTGLVFGQPGTGKSTAAYYYACCLAGQGWQVIWIHIGKQSLAVAPISCVLLDQTRKRTCEGQDINAMFNQVVGSSVTSCKMGRVLFLDGMTTADEFKAVEKSALIWGGHGRDSTEERRLFFISSMSSSNRHIEEDELHRRRVFKQYSWTWNEYEKALGSKVFAEYASLFLVGDTTQTRNDNTTRPVDLFNWGKEKYYYAGGCARFMFQFNLVAVKNTINDCIDSVQDYQGLLNGNIGPSPNGSLNRLFSVLPDTSSNDGSSLQSLVSKYAGDKLAHKLGPNRLKIVSEHDVFNSNNAMNGFLLEAYFFACVRLGSVKIFRKGGNDTQFEEWTCMPSTIDTVVDHNCPTTAQCLDKTWLRPALWNQASYDAVFLDRQLNMIRFVQITRKPRHGIDLHILGQLVKNLIKNGVLSRKPNLSTVEVYFLVPRKLENFTISPLSNPTALSDFGWPRQKALALERIKIGFIDFPMD